MYSLPVAEDDFGLDFKSKWNGLIKYNYDKLLSLEKKFYLLLDPAQIKKIDAEAAVKWFADPAEPTFCINDEKAQKLCDWGSRGREVLQNEYCEYAIIKKEDMSGKLRPKRIELSTELREYWLLLATYFPNELKNLTERVLKEKVTWEDLYAHPDPQNLSPMKRKVKFATQVAGHGGDAELEKKFKVPRYPNGDLNKRRCLFMLHTINGLDDLIYIVLFGSVPYARKMNGKIVQATKEQIFKSADVEQLACRHADPAAAMGAYGAAFEGRHLAFKDPLGVYIQSFSKDIFLYNDEPIPDEWIQWERKNIHGLPQRLVIGPPDNEDIYLDDIQVADGAETNPLKGGFQILQHVEVGPTVLIGPKPGKSLEEKDYKFILSENVKIQCGDAKICTTIRNLESEYNDNHPLGKIAPRQLGCLE